MTYVYLIINEVGDSYLGSTIDLKRRMIEHNSGRSSYTKGHVWKLVYYEAYFSELDARLREKKLKNFGQSMTHLKNRLSSSLSKISEG